MPSPQGPRLSRRNFILGTAATTGALILGFRFAGKSGPAQMPANGTSRAINSWIRIAADGAVTIFVAKAEMGQGIHTAMAMLVAEELEVKWESVRVEPAPLAPEYFLGDLPVTSGSRSVRLGFLPLREAGAVAREMLVAAAARSWAIPAQECHARDGFVWRNDDGSKLPYAELVASAASLPVPPVPPLKPSAQWSLLGKPQTRLDAIPKCNGTAIFGVDIILPGMLHAAVRHSPAFGGELLNLPELQAAAPRGVKILAVKGGVAAASQSYWISQRALQALPARFSQPGSPGESSESLSAALWRRLETAGDADISERRGEGPLAAPARTIEARYEAPFLAHATMEPPTCVARVDAGSCELWLGTKSAVFARNAAAAFLGLAEDQVVVHSLPMGGSFGRKGESDFVLQAVSLSRDLGQPVKLIWSREEDLQHDFYRPAAVAHLKASLGKSGEILSWEGTNVVATYESGHHLNIEHLNAQKDVNFARLGYDILRMTVRSALLPTPVPVGFWRSTASSFNTFFVESFIDEIASATARDPLAMRKKLLAKLPKNAAVLQRAADLAGWGSKRAAGRALGLAYEEIRDTRTALVAEVSLEGTSFRVLSLSLAYDCGPVVNPDGVEAQLQGGLLFGLSACLHGKITLREGRVQESNFQHYKMVRMESCPLIRIARVEGGAQPGGIGEAGVALVAPAVANAVARAGGARMRNLPFLRG